MNATLHAFGELLIDATPSGSEEHGAFSLPRLTLFPGGAPANVAAQVAKLGGRARVPTCVSSDPWGALLRKALATCGVDPGALVTTDAPTALAIVQLSENGDRSFRFFRNATADLAITLDQIDFEAIRPGDVAHACSNCLTVEPARTVALGSLKRAKSRGALISVDPNLRRLLWQDGRVDPEPVWALLAPADLVKASVEEARELAGSVDAFAARCLKSGARCVIISDGENPLRAVFSGGEVTQAAPAVRAVDTTGAGDSLCGGLIAALLAEGDAGAALDRRLADPETLRRWLRFGAACGALTVTRSGAMPAMPDRAEVEAFLRNEG